MGVTISVSISISVSLCIYVWVYMRVYIYIHTCIHAYPHIQYEEAQAEVVFPTNTICALRIQPSNPSSACRHRVVHLVALCVPVAAVALQIW